MRHFVNGGMCVCVCEGNKCATFVEWLINSDKIKSDNDKRRICICSAVYNSRSSCTMASWDSGKKAFPDKIGIHKKSLSLCASIDVGIAKEEKSQRNETTHSHLNLNWGILKRARDWWLKTKFHWIYRWDNR